MLQKVKRAYWIDIQTSVIWYGIKGLGNDGKWYYLSEGGKALVYASDKERDAKLRSIREKIKNSNAVDSST